MKRAVPRGIFSRRVFMFRVQLSDLSPDQLQLSLGLRMIMKERGLVPQENSSLKEALPPFLRLASIVRLGKAKVRRIF